MSATEVAAKTRAFERAVETGNPEAIAALLARDVMIRPPAGPVVCALAPTANPIKTPKPKTQFHRIIMNHSQSRKKLFVPWCLGG